MVDRTAETTALAVTRSVTSGANSGRGSLRSVLGTAGAGDLVAFAPGVSTVTLTTPLASAASITIDGAAGRAGSPDAVIAGTAALVLSGVDTIGSLTIGGTVELRNAGTLTQSADIVVGDGSGGGARLTNAAGHTWSLSGATSILAGNGAASFNNAGGTLAYAGQAGDVSTIGVDFVNLSGQRGTITVAGGTLQFAGGTNDLTNELIQSDTGEVAITAGHTVIGSGTVLAVKDFVLANIGTVLAIDTDSYFTTGSFSFDTGATLDLRGHTLNVGEGRIGSDQGAAPIITGGGTFVINSDVLIQALAIDGSTLLRNNVSVSQSGTIVLGEASGAAARITNASTGLWSLLSGDLVAGNQAATFNNGGGQLNTYQDATVGVNFVNTGASAGTVSVLGGTLTFTGHANVFDRQTIDGAGTFAIDGGRSRIGAGTTVVTSAWALGGSGTVLRLDADLGYSGAFSDTGTTSIDLGGHRLGLGGTALFGSGEGTPVVTGSGQLALSGNTTIGALAIAGHADVSAGGVTTQNGSVRIASGASLTVGTGAAWTAEAGSITAATAGALGTVNLAGGVWHNAVSGSTAIMANVTNGSTATGTLLNDASLEIGGTLTGPLDVSVGPRLILDKAVSADVTAEFTFTGSTQTLQLNDASAFHGSVAGFNARDALDLRSIAYGAGGPSITFTPSNGTGTLAVSDGTHTADITLLGKHTLSAFHLASDRHGGTTVTYG